MRSLLLVVLTSLAVLLLAVPALAADVALTADGFEPAEVQIAAGDTVIWVNETEDEVTIEGADGTWDSGPLASGESFSVAFTDEGEVAYATADGAHEGVVVVGDAGTDEDDDSRDPFAGAAGEEGGDTAAGADGADTAGAEASGPEAAEADLTLPNTGVPAAALAVGAVGALAAGGLVLRRTRR